MNVMRRLIPLFAFLWLLGPLLPLGGQGPLLGSSLQDAAREGVRERQLVPMNRVISSLRQRNSGRLLDADLQRQRGGPVYAVRWLTDDGRRIDYVVDARTGDVLSANGE